MKLPKALLVAVLSSTMAFGAGSYVTTEIISVPEGEIKLSEDTDAYGYLTASITDPTSKFYLNYDQKDVASGSDAPKAVVKDGQGTFIIDKSFDTYNPFVVREGTVRIEAGVEINSYVKLVNAVSNLSVGGNNAHLVLDGATYTQDAASGTRPNSAIAIGTTDGAGKLTLDNGAVLKNGHCIFAGYSQLSGYVTSTSVSATDTNQYTNGVAGRSEINVLGGSTLGAGEWIQIANADVTVSGYVDGKRSTLSDANYVLLENYWGYMGRADNSKSTISVKEGGLVDLQYGTWTGLGANSQSNITVDGKSGETASTLKMGGTSFLGLGGYDYTTKAYASNGSSTSITVTNGAQAYVGEVYMGEYDKVNITIGEKSLLGNVDENNPQWIYVYDKGSIDNSGSTEASICLSGGSFTAHDKSSMAELYAYSGTFAVDGTVDAWGDISLSNAEFIFADGAVIDLNGNDFTFGEGSSITIIMSELETQLVMLADADSTYEIQGITFNNAGSVTGLDGDIEVTLLSSADADPENAQKVILSASKVTVNPVPEPTTATLSLLALAGLAMRRRRK